jgi:hypothetical protein
MTEVKTPVDEKPVLADQADMDGASALAALASAASLAQNTSVKQEAKGIKNEYDEVRTNRTYTATKIPCMQRCGSALVSVRIWRFCQCGAGSRVLMSKHWKKCTAEKKQPFFRSKIAICLHLGLHKGRLSSSRRLNPIHQKRTSGSSKLEFSPLL